MLAMVSVVHWPVQMDVEVGEMIIELVGGKVPRLVTVVILAKLVGLEVVMDELPT